MNKFLKTFCLIWLSKKVSIKILGVVKQVSCLNKFAQKVMDCLKCEGIKHCDAGFAKGKQHYLYKTRVYHYAVREKSGIISKETKCLALELYLECLGFRTIERIVKVSFVRAYYW